MTADRIRLKVPLLCGNLGPGYDTFGMALEKFNFIEMWVTPEGLKVEIIGEGADFLPRDASCVVYKAVDEVFRKHNSMLPGLSIRIENNIPVGKGLGSFAGAVAAGVFGANYLLGNPFTQSQLIAIAASKVGSTSNVAAAFLGNFVITSRYEDVYSSAVFPAHIQPVLVIPDVPCYNPLTVKKNIAQKVSLEDANYNMTHAALLAISLCSNEYSELLKMAFSDRLVCPHRQSYFPGARDIFLYLQSIDSYGISFCNDGPSFVFFLKSGRDCLKHINKVERLLKSRDISAAIHVLPVSGQGISIE
ncbi:MAG: hypothetical protein PHQ23_06150 [Candidatus Wallbacteria bacterium]|nr:hypothetical protein [Candidatus Wallbacteria bacterium]